MYIVRAVFRTLALVLVFSIAIVTHECGHYVFDKLSGIPVAEVCLGDGPVLIEGHLPDGALLRIRAIPFSGYVEARAINTWSAPPTWFDFIGMFSAGVVSTTIWACIMFMLFAALSGLKPGFWRPLWFGLRRSFITLLVLPAQMVYGILTFQFHGMIMKSWPVRMLVPFLLDDYFVHEENGRCTVLPHGAVQWIGMIAVVLMAVSAIGMLPVSFESDPAIIIRITYLYLGWLPVDALMLITIIQAAIGSLIILFVIQTLLLVVLLWLRSWLEQRKLRESKEE